MAEVIKIAGEKEAASAASYSIYTGAGIRSSIGEVLQGLNYSAIFVLTDSTVESLWAAEIADLTGAVLPVITVPAGEKSKTLGSAETVWQKLLEAGADRSSILINTGGGMVTDLGGFVASCFMRGMRFINVPTSLLAQVDASVGAKTGVNFAGVKNIIGTFNRPLAVIIDTETLQTLSEREWRSGVAEVIKHGVVYDSDYFSEVETALFENIDRSSWGGIISGSCKIKAAIVQQDEFELGQRKLLNFGHTIGHGIEAVSANSDHPYLHGEAIALGMIAESRIAVALGLLAENDCTRIEKLVAASGLPVTMEMSCGITEICHALSYDKKKQGSTIYWTLPVSCGSAVINQKVADIEVERALKTLYRGEVL